MLLGKKPPFNTARGAADTALLVVPPFSFPGVTCRVFPLRANVNRLGSFCENYLNVAPEVCEFHPYLPFVFLVVVDYGQMAIEKANLGWVSQHEIFFAVPLGKWRRDRGRPVFQEWVLNTPFIFVDNPTSLTAGREAYGWPKVLATLRPSLKHGLIDPRKAVRFLSLELEGFGSRQDGKAVRLLDIDQRLGQNPSLVPLDLSEANPFDWISRLARDTFSAGWDLAQFLLGAPLSGYGPSAPGGGGRAEALFEGLRQLSGFYGQPGVDVVTLKQFRNAEDPAHICYQSLVQSRLGISRYNRGGPLGLYNLLQGDASGGFRVHLHKNPSFSIVESLGLEVSRERMMGGHPVSVVEPVLPFWVNVDLTYGKGRTLCHRQSTSPWYRKGVPVAPARGGSRSPSPALYNTYAGAAQQVWGGPFFMPKARWNVFPLKADGSALRRFVDEYLNSVSQSCRFEPWGSHVYMVASRSRAFSKVLSAAWLDAEEISFVVPLIRHHQDRQDFILATPFAFIDNPTVATTQREVTGVPAVDATFENTDRFWHRKGPLLRMKVDVFTALDAGLQSERRTLLEVVHGAAPPAASGSPPPSDPCCDLVRALGSHPLDLHKLTLKQFRDAEDPNQACYQSLVLEKWTFARPGRVERLKPGTAIKIYRYPSLPIADKLGLVHSMVLPREMAGAIAYILVPDDPFRIELDIHVGRAEAMAQTPGFLPCGPGEDGLGAQVHDELLSGGPQPLIQAFLLDSMKESTS